ncbi:unnamed protein product [Peronospora belbahrii]|uniref:Secreted protein n=1 Tax=Peronospora belbahrii TaxID=622444 RepID=A0ABN8DBJ7_9STRA|nr:unnamed protein product [Peronospora belbahrii]
MIASSTTTCQRFITLTLLASPWTYLSPVQTAFLSLLTHCHLLSCDLKNCCSSLQRCNTLCQYSEEMILSSFHRQKTEHHACSFLVLRRCNESAITLEILAELFNISCLGVHFGLATSKVNHSLRL